MKTLTAFAAVAALVAGVAVANAQSSNMGASTNMPASSTSGTAAWCLQDTGAATQLSCKFASQADCQKEAKGKGTCIQNTGTTGSGMSTKTDKKQ
jgi:hypothetical protein